VRRDSRAGGRDDLKTGDLDRQSRRRRPARSTGGSVESMIREVLVQLVVVITIKATKLIPCADSSAAAPTSVA
jgi:hypothetical protein